MSPEVFFRVRPLFGKEQISKITEELQEERGI
jgi:hypothetical protein